jgi:MYXO-CTERM domain-containing protein
MSEPLHHQSIHELGERIRIGVISPVALTRACLARIQALQPRLNAFITVLGDRALQQAAEAERQIRAGRWRGPLHGIPVGVKDFYDTAGVRTTAAFEHFTLGGEFSGWGESSTVTLPDDSGCQMVGGPGQRAPWTAGAVALLLLLLRRRRGDVSA